MGEFRYIAAALLIASIPAAAWGQGAAGNYPAKPVMVVVPFDGDGSIQTEYRLYAQSVLEATGKQFLVENRGGAGGTIGTAYVARATPDGYTVLGTNTGFAITPAIYHDLLYDPLKDIAPVTLLSKKVFFLVVHPASPLNNVQDYIAYARAHPGEINFSTAGMGTTTHLPGALLHYVTRTTVTFIPYKAPGQRLVDLMAGRVQAAVVSPVTGLANIKAGKMKPLGVTSSERIALFPELPTIAEQGVPGFEFSSWTGLFAPARTPVAIISRLNAFFVAATRDNKYTRQLDADGSILLGTTSEQFRQFVGSETKKYGDLIRDTGIKPAIE
jgi:tripartite-type tricarboxylate transporter receptor subunit TctC